MAMSRSWITFTTSVLLISCLLSLEFAKVSCNSDDYYVVSGSSASSKIIPIENSATSSDFDDSHTQSHNHISIYQTENDQTNNDNDTNNSNSTNDNNDSNNNNATAPTTGPTNAPTPAITSPIAPSTPPPTPAVTHPPTKKYEPPSDDNNDSSDENDTDNEGKKEEEKKPSVGIIFLWIVLIFGLIWVVCYFRDAILFFMVSAWNNTRRYGCKGCMQSFCPCLAGSRGGGGGGSGGGSSEPLDQIIFETDDAGLSRGLMD